jgi:hypothetical protein
VCVQDLRTLAAPECVGGVGVSCAVFLFSFEKEGGEVEVDDSSKGCKKAIYTTLNLPPEVKISCSGEMV